MTSKTGTILTVESESQIPELEKTINDGKVSFVFVNAEWCPHCVNFKKDIWQPMCKKPALHNRIAVKADLINKTSLSNANYKYLPSILVINEKGKPEEFQTPEGETTNAMPTPKSIEDMTKAVNVPLKPMSEEQRSELEKEERIQQGGSLYQTLTQISRGIGLKKLCKRTYKKKSIKRRKTKKDRK